MHMSEFLWLTEKTTVNKKKNLKMSFLVSHTNIVISFDTSMYETSYSSTHRSSFQQDANLNEWELKFSQ